MPKLEAITSAANPLLKDVRRAIARGTLTESGCCAAESFHLLHEALRSGLDVPVVLAAASAEPEVERQLGRAPRTRLAVVDDRVFHKIAGTETSQGVVALVRPRAWQMEQLFGGDALVVVLDGVQDPGNAGAIVRAAEAFGGTGVVFVKGSASPFNGKTLRASAGSLFRVPYTYGVADTLVRGVLEQNRVDIYAGVPHPAGTAVGDVDLTRRVAFVIGSEGSGVGDTLRAAARDLAIPTMNVESLNAALAAGIMLYEAQRQRSAAP
jgi:TrmH family RNA methyltransferase